MTDAAFGSDPVMTIDELAHAVKHIKVTKTPSHKLSDVIDIIEHLRDHALSLHQANLDASAKLAERQAELLKREQELALKQKAVAAVLKAAPPPRRYFWR